MARIAKKIRAAAIADLLAGEQPAAVAATYGLDPTIVRQWKTRYVTSDSADVPARTPPSVAAQKASMGELIIECLRSQLQAIHAVAEITTDPEWAKRQSAAELAVFGQWLVSSALAIGDRLAHGAAPPHE